VHVGVPEDTGKIAEIEFLSDTIEEGYRQQNSDWSFPVKLIPGELGLLICLAAVPNLPALSSLE